MMLMQVTCPHCGARYQFERSLIPQAGYDAQCANCSGIFVVAPDASGNEPPIALPSMSMIDTWLAPPALAPKQARASEADAAATLSRSATGTTGASSTPIVQEINRPQVVRPKNEGQATVTVLPVGGRGGQSSGAAPFAASALQYSIACPKCDTVYAFAANDVPLAGLDAPCTKCQTPYRLTRIGDPQLIVDMSEHDDTIPVAAEILRQLDDDPSSPSLRQVLADEDTTPDGEGRGLGPSEGAIELTLSAAMAEGPTGDWRIEEGVVLGAEGGEPGADSRVLIADHRGPITDSRLPIADGRGPTADSRLPITDDRGPIADSRLPTTDVRGPITDSRLPTSDDRGPTADSRLPITDDRGPTADSRLPLAEGPTAGAGIAARSEDPPLVEEVTKPFAAAVPRSADIDEDAPTVVQAREDLQLMRPETSASRAIVPLAVSERSRAGAGTWGPPDPSSDPQAVMRRSVRTAGEEPERSKKRRPPFDDDDVKRLRRDNGPIIKDPREFDDEDSVYSKVGLRGKHRNTILGATGLALIVALVCGMVPLMTGKSVVAWVRLRVVGDPRTQELIGNARTALLADTDVGYRDAAKAANDVLDIDNGNTEGRVIYGIASVFRGVDVRATAQNMVAEGEVVQSSQMLATASAELAHARRVLSRKNDDSAELAFTSGIYYALDEDQRSLARDAYVRGMKLSKLAEDAPPPTPYAAYLQATLRNLEGDAAGARAALERALLLEPRWQRPRYELARLEAARGEIGRARELAGEVLAANADHHKAKDLLAVLPDTPVVPTAAKTKVEPKPVEPKPEDPHPAATPEAPKTTAPPAPTPPPGDVKAALERAKSEDAPPPEEPKPTPQKAKPAPQPESPSDGTAPEIQTPPDQPRIIRGAPPPFQQGGEAAPDEGEAAPQENQP